MFLSNPNFPVDLPSSMDHVFPPQDSLPNQEKYDVQFNYLHTIEEDPGEFLFHAYGDTAAIAPPVQNTATTFDQEFIWQPQKFSERWGLQYGDDGGENLLDSVISSHKKKMASYKKDENRKIDTAQGPRDRRVRFSTEIARKFFGLQDLLGFDRASKTLNWLLNNSVTAIKELVEEKRHDSSDRSNLKFLEAIINGGGSDENVNGGKKKSVVECVDGKETKTKRKHEAESFRVVNNVARDQSRAAARARARERTREKMRVKKLDHDSKLTFMKSGGCWSTEIEPKSDYENMRCECIIDPETTPMQSKDSSSLCNSFYQNLEHYFHD